MSIAFFILGWGVGFTGYLTIQCASVLTLHGRFRLEALIPLPFMVLLLVHTAQAYAAGSSLWPLLLILYSPGAASGLVLVWCLGLVREGRARLLFIPAFLVAALLGLATLGEGGTAIFWSGMFTISPAFGLLAVSAIAEVIVTLRERRLTAHA